MHARPLLMVALCAAALAAAAPAHAYTVANRTDYGAGINPLAAGSADFDWDGDQDLFIGNFSSDDVTLRLNDGAGVFGAPTSLPVGDGIYNLALADVNGDLRPDLVSVNYWGNTASVLINDGAGGFLPKVDYPCGGNPTGLALADLDGDGDRDLVTVNYWAATVSVLLNNGGAGVFGPPTAYATAAGPQNVALGDLDGDGDQDLVTCNIDANSVSVLLNLGTGVFGGANSYATGLFPYSVELGDVDNDGKLDVVTANYTSSSISVLKGDGAGALNAKNDFASGGGATWVQVVDVNLDRRLDVVTANYDANSASVLLGDGAGNYPSHADFAAGAGPWAMIATDLSRDGQVDIVVTNNTAGTASVLLGDLPGGFAPGDTAVAFKALDQNGVERSLSEFAGKWVLLDLSAVWCSPCNQLGSETQRVYDTWVGHPTVQFEYVTVLVQGQTVAPSTESHADKWGCRYKISRPILHAAGTWPNTLNSYFEGVDGVAFPTLAVIDPNGIVRRVVVGALPADSLVAAFAGLAGVAAPALAPAPTTGPCAAPPPPTPPSGVRTAWMPLAQANLHVSYDGVEFTAPGASPWDPDPVSRVIDYLFDINNPPAGLPGASGQVFAQVDSTTGIETIMVAFYRNDGGPIALAEPWSARLSEMGWPDGLARVMVEPTNPVVAAYYLEVPGDLGSNQIGFGTALVPALAYSSGQMTLSAFDLSTVPGLPPDPFAWIVTGASFQHEQTVGVGAPGVPGRLLVGSMWPNPAGQTSTLRWALPRAGHARVDIVDVSGRLVRTLVDRTLEAGAQVTPWDLRDDGGRRVGAGVYFARVNAAGESGTARIAVIR